MTDRVSTDTMLARAVADLEAADAFERLDRAIFERHQPIGYLLQSMGELHHLERATVLEASEGIVAGFYDTSEHFERTWRLLHGFGTDGQADLTAAIQGIGDVHPTAEGAVLRVWLSEVDAGLLMQELLDLAEAPDRTIVLGRNGHRAWLQVRGRPARVELRGYLDVSSAGLVGAAGGILVCNGAPRPVVAECWLPAN